jgi:hypothetical protein
MICVIGTVSLRFWYTTISASGRGINISVTNSKPVKPLSASFISWPYLVSICMQFQKRRFSASVHAMMSDFCLRQIRTVKRILLEVEEGIRRSILKRATRLERLRKVMPVQSTVRQTQCKVCTPGGNGIEQQASPGFEQRIPFF